MIPDRQWGDPAKPLDPKNVNRRDGHTNPLNAPAAADERKDK